MKKIYILLITFLIIGFISFAEEVPIETAKLVAKNFFYQNSLFEYDDIILEDGFSYGDKDSPRIYIFNIKDNQGHVIVSTIDNIVPILGFSENENFQSSIEIPPFKYMIDELLRQIEFVLSNKIEATYDIQNEWASYINYTPSSKEVKGVNEILTADINWGQGSIYNDACPDPVGANPNPPGNCPYPKPPDPPVYHDQCVAGCVAVAMAQIMRYWKHPQTGTGNISYNHPTFGPRSVNFSTANYNWNNMPGTAVPPPQNAAANADIAQIIYHAGVSVAMNYDCYVSGSNNIQAASAFKLFFNYSPNIRCYSKDSFTGDWNNMIQNELDNGRPVYYAGRRNDAGTMKGHAFVCDGYNTAGLFHFNFGWYGNHNAWLNIDIIQTGHVPPRKYEFDQETIINIEPSAGQQVDQTDIIPFNQNHATGYVDADGDMFSPIISIEEEPSPTTNDFQKRGYIKFDISSIPVGVTITGITLCYYNYFRQSFSSVPNYIYDLATDPTSLTVIGTDLYNDCGSGDRYDTIQWNRPLADNWYFSDLNSHAVGDLNTAITNSTGWFGVGIIRNTDGTSRYDFRGYNHANRPFLIVFYKEDVVTWNQNIDNDWCNPANWNPVGIPAFSDNVVIPSLSLVEIPNEITCGCVEVNSIELHDNATLRILPMGCLTVFSNFINSGYFHIQSNNLGQSGSYIGYGSNTGAGTFQFDRYVLPELLLPDEGWHYISSPIDNSVSGDITSYWLKEWQEPNNIFHDIDPYPGSNFCDGTSTGTVALEVMKGYSMKRDLTYPITNPCTPPNCCWVPPLHLMPGQVIDVISYGGDAYGTFAGCNNFAASATNPAKMTNLNSGNISRRITASNNPVNIYPNWNLIGNPYPSVWDYDLFFISPNWPAAGLNDAIYYWDSFWEQYASYVNGVGNNGGDEYVPPTQGFFFEADGTVAQIDLTFTNDERTHVGRDKYYKSDISNLLRLEVEGDLRDQTTIRFLEEASFDFDGKYDAKKMFSEGENIPSLYTKGGKHNLSINSLPETNDISLYFRPSASNRFTLKAADNDFDKVLLLDLKNGIIHNLSTPYIFNAIEGDNEDRFIIHFGEISTSTENSGFVIYSSQSNIVVYNINNQLGDVSVYNVVGQFITSHQLEDGLNNITLDNAHGYYIVNVRTSESVVNKKVYIH